MQAIIGTIVALNMFTEEYCKWIVLKNGTNISPVSLKCTFVTKYDVKGEKGSVPSLPFR